MPTIANALRSIGIEHGINRLHPYHGGAPLPLAPGHAAEVVRVGGGGRVFVVVLQPQWPSDSAISLALVV